MFKVLKSCRYRFLITILSENKGTGHKFDIEFASNQNIEGIDIDI